MRIPSQRSVRGSRHFQILRRRRQQRATKQSAAPTSATPTISSTVDADAPSSSRQQQRPSIMGAKMSSYATNPSSYYYSSSNSKTKEAPSSSSSSTSPHSSSMSTSSSTKVADGGSPDSAGSNPTDGEGVKPPSTDPPSDLLDGHSSGSSKATASLYSSPLSKRQKASEAALLLLTATPGLTNEDDDDEYEYDEYDNDDDTSGNVEDNNSKSTAGTAADGNGIGSNDNDGSGLFSEALSECSARLLLSGTAEGIGIESLKVDDDDDVDDDDVDDDDEGKEEILVDDKNIGAESRDDEENELTIGGIGGGGGSVSTSTILQTLLGGGGGNTTNSITTDITSTAASSKNLGHIGDGRRTAKAKLSIGSGGGSGDALDEDGKGGSKAEVKSKLALKSKAKVKPSSTTAIGTQEMPIQMMTSRRIVPNSTPTTNTGTNQRLSREVRGLIASAGDAENVHPNTSSATKKGGGGLGGVGKPLTRSKAKLQQQKPTQKKKSVPPHLLQEHPSVRNKPTKTNTGTKSSSGSGGGLTSVLRNRAAQQAASPAIVPTPSHIATPDNPRIVTINDCRVTLIDDERKVFVIDAVTPDMCDRIRTMTDDYVRETALTHPNKQTWRTLYTYTKMDLPCGEVTGLMKKAVDGIMKNVVSIVGTVYGNRKAAAKLKPRSWKEPHLLHYQVLPGKPEHLGIEMHYDGCDVTWSLMLSGNDEYEGGGTYIRCLRKTIMLKQGQILVHPGELVSAVAFIVLFAETISHRIQFFANYIFSILPPSFLSDNTKYHKGNHITSGTRSMIVAFVSFLLLFVQSDLQQ